MSNSTDTTTEQDLQEDVLKARMVVGMTSLIMFMIIVMGSVYFKVWKAPRFLWLQCLLLGLCNLGGLIISSSLIGETIYDSKGNFYWQGTWLGIYFATNLMAGWFFAYRYLLTSRSLKTEVMRRRDLAIA